MSSSLTVPGIKQKVFIGCSDEELYWPQILSIDIKIYFDMSSAIAEDDIKKTVNYLEVIELLEGLCKEKKWKLIETLSNDIGAKVLDRWSYVTKVKVSTSKRVSEKCDPVICRLEIFRQTIQ